MQFRTLDFDSRKRTVSVSALASCFTVLIALTSHAGPIGNYCEIDIKCEVSPYGLSDEVCAVQPVADVTFHYNFIGGHAEIVDDKLGVIGIYRGKTLTRTVTIGNTEIHTATFRPINTVCAIGIFSDSVLIQHGQPTPTATATATPIPTPTATPTPPPPCLWPEVKIVTRAKGQSPTNNAKLVHSITGRIIDPASVSDTAHRIEVCVGTRVTALVNDSTGSAANTASGSLLCHPGACWGVVNVQEQYKSVSADGQDKDTIIFIPK